MDAHQTPQLSILRQAFRLTLGVWLFTFILFLMPTLIGRGSLPAFVVGTTLLCTVVGILLSLPVYIVAARMQSAPAWLNISCVAASVCLSALLLSVADLAMGGGVMSLFMSGAHIASDPLSHFVSDLISYSWLYGLLATIYVVLHTIAAMRDREVQLFEAQALAQKAQLTALRLQLNPHFLFNTLNAISSLIVTGRVAEGETMLGKLSDFLRTALVESNRGDTTLAEELEVLQTYLEIEAVRFGDRLNVEFDAPDLLLHLLVPNLILQPLVENALKYAVAPTSRPVTIRISASLEGPDLLLSVSDDGAMAFARARKNPAGTGVGLENIRRRLNVLYGSRGRLKTIARSDGFTALVRLPVAERAPEVIVTAA